MKTNATPSRVIPIQHKLKPKRHGMEVSVAAPDGFAVAIFVKSPCKDACSRQPEVVARAAAPEQDVRPAPDGDQTYKCKNCGKRMPLRDTADYYGLPACPACLKACAPFEIVAESPDASPAEDPCDHSN